MTMVPVVTTKSSGLCLSWSTSWTASTREATSRCWWQQTGRSTALGKVCLLLLAWLWNMIRWKNGEWEWLPVQFLIGVWALCRGKVSALVEQVSAISRHVVYSLLFHVPAPMPALRWWDSISRLKQCAHCLQSSLISSDGQPCWWTDLVCLTCTDYSAFCLSWVHNNVPEFAVKEPALTYSDFSVIFLRVQNLHWPIVISLWCSCILQTRHAWPCTHSAGPSWSKSRIWIAWSRGKAWEDA